MFPRIMFPTFWYWAFMGLLIIMRWLRCSFCIWVMCYATVSAILMKQETLLTRVC